MFTHFHVHTEYSLLDGHSRIPELVARAKALGMEALAITDHGTLYGIVDFYSGCKEAGIKPIIGCELYVAPASRHSKTPKDKAYYHLTVLAKNNRGYQNLIQLVTLANLEGFYYKPRVDRELLEKYNEGLVVLSGCPSGEIPRLLAQGQMDEAKEVARWYSEVFDDYFLEIQRHDNIEGLPAVNAALVDMSREMGIPLVATNDNHYTLKEDARFQDVLICLQTSTTLDDETRMKMPDESFYLKSHEEMAELFSDLPEAVEITGKIADMCEVELDFDHPHLPEYKAPGGKTAEEYLRHLCYEGFKQRYPEGDQQAEERLAYELDVIEETQFPDYFLVVWDIAKFVRERGILFGVRGSAAASVALYCLGVTDIDPLEYRLVFERFLNVERKEMPDIDMDFQDDRRDEVLDYVTQRYGQGHVAQIITFGTLGPRAAVRDVGRVLGMSYADVDGVARLIHFRARTLEEALKMNPEFQNAIETDDSIGNLVRTARGVEGIPHHFSTHAAGVVISQDPLANYVPLQRPSRGGEDSNLVMTQYSMGPIAKLGLLKMDFLGLTNLTTLDKAIKMVKQNRGLDIDLHEVPLDDLKTFELLSSGETTEIFQLEGEGMRRHIKGLKPTSLKDVAAMIALYRPGPMEHIDTFINAKHGRTAAKYPHPTLKDILEETYGVIVYQDQVLLIAQAFAGYSLGEADVVRKAMGKKIAEVMGQEREKFIKGAIQQGYDQALAEQVFDLIEPFAGYAFNKSHSVSYALIAYWTAYFKANYPVEYMASVLNSRLGNQEKSANTISECFRLGIPVLLPDVNYSGVGFAINRDEKGQEAIRFGLAAIKNVGEGAVQPLVEERDDEEPFKSVEDFCRRGAVHGLNRRIMESLIKAGALDSLGNRGALLASIDRILSLAQQEARLRDSGQTSMLDLFGEEVPVPMEEISLEGGDVLPRELMAWEKELLGRSLTVGSTVAIQNNLGAITSRANIDASMDGKTVKIIGQISSTMERMTRKGGTFVIGTLELAGGSLEVIAWPDIYEASRDLWQEDSFLYIEGRVKEREGETSVHCNDVRLFHVDGQNAHISANDQTPLPLEPSSSTQTYPQRTLLIGLVETGKADEDAFLVHEVLRTCLEYPGGDRVNMEIHTDRQVVRLDVPIVATKYCSDLHRRLESLTGVSNLGLLEGSGNGSTP